jgi:hypothetical protein
MIIYLISVTDEDGTQCYFFTIQRHALDAMPDIVARAKPGAVVVLSEHKISHSKGPWAQALNAAANAGPDIADRLGGKRQEIKTIIPGGDDQ